MFRLLRGRERCVTVSTRRVLGVVVGVMGLLALAVACGGGSGTTKGPVTLNWYIFPESSGAFVKSSAQCSAHSNGAYNIKIQTLPNAADVTPGIDDSLS